jgi:hypothetical protein
MWLKRGFVGFLESLCGVLDHLPGFGYSRECGWWFSRYGDWGCYPLRLSRLSVDLDDKWGTGYWVTVEQSEEDS